MLVTRLQQTSTPRAGARLFRTALLFHPHRHVPRLSIRLGVSHMAAPVVPAFHRAQPRNIRDCLYSEGFGLFIAIHSPPSKGSRKSEPGGVRAWRGCDRTCSGADDAHHSAPSPSAGKMAIEDRRKQRRGVVHRFAFPVRGVLLQRRACPCSTPTSPASLRSALRRDGRPHPSGQLASTTSWDRLSAPRSHLRQRTRSTGLASRDVYPSAMGSVVPSRELDFPPPAP